MFGKSNIMPSEQVTLSVSTSLAISTTPDPKCSRMVMMIDDDGDTLEIYRLLVEKTDYSPFFITFGSVASALNYLHESTEQQRPFPKYILLDLNMPGQGGIDFI